VNERAATEMAVGATKLLTVEACVAVTGAAGPDPLDGAPPGTVVIAAAIDGVTSAATYTFPGSADIVRHRAAEAALRHLGYQLQAAVRR
jgi:nicotinamide-nucleotide amidase